MINDDFVLFKFIIQKIIEPGQAVWSVERSGSLKRSERPSRLASTEGRDAMEWEGLELSNMT